MARPVRRPAGGRGGSVAAALVRGGAGCAAGLRGDGARSGAASLPAARSGTAAGSRGHVRLFARY